MPSYIPFHLKLVYLSGLVEIICGLLLLFPQTQTFGAYLAILLFVAVFPANIEIGERLLYRPRQIFLDYGVTFTTSNFIDFVGLSISKIMADHNEFGKLAEDLAVKFLEDLKYKILVRNFRFMKAEIDIIAEFENEIIIIEVKARSTDAFMEPQEAINRKNMRLLISAANEFSENYKKDLNTRFDVITILPDDKKKLQITHIINAFESIDSN
ncbi:YraN family protein [Halpernia sp. GG3]